ncbi:hypothetical protein GCM10023340_16700 [Nocardioides marinquilinus]|uniref:Uncharacterized protein n=1 Tax=Nocardioides marinquilinus TaxID=1210400 RepID=A0ABP9PHD2_9ACTN
MTTLGLLALVVTAAPADEDVVAGWTAFALFGLGIVAIALLGWSLTKRLKNVDRAAEQGLYDPSDPKKQRPARGLAAVREQRRLAEQQDGEHAPDGEDDAPRDR